MPSFEQILFRVADRVATITFNRPERLNAWTHQMEHEVRQAVDLAAADDGVRAIVLTGAGRGFCAGADMEALGERAKSGTRPPAAPAPASAGNFAQRYSYFAAAPKPVIAGINGPAAGIGFVLTLFCDIRYMAEGAKLSTSFARRGLIAEHGSAWMLPRLVGTMHALDLLMSARAVTAHEAAAMNLVKLLPAEGFAEAVQAAARDLAQLSSPRSMRLIKQQVYQAHFQTLAEATTQANAELTKCFDTEDFREGVAHYVEKRRPNFTGR
jgi:enoyl-CoA hydratase/carnithine racemase